MTTPRRWEADALASDGVGRALISRSSLASCRRVRVAPSVAQMAGHLLGPDQPISDPRYDRDGDGDMDLRDLASLQLMYTD